MTDAITIALIVAIPSTIASVATLISSARTRTAVDGRMDEMLKIVKDAAFAAGRKQQKDDPHG